MDVEVAQHRMPVSVSSLSSQVALCPLGLFVNRERVFFGWGNRTGFLGDVAELRSILDGDSTNHI